MAEEVHMEELQDVSKEAFNSPFIFLLVINNNPTYGNVFKPTHLGSGGGGSCTATERGSGGN
jgi:hypothetical protein